MNQDNDLRRLIRWIEACNRLTRVALTIERGEQFLQRHPWHLLMRVRVWIMRRIIFNLRKQELEARECAGVRIAP